jgi:hydrogenase maturation protease
MEGRVFVPTSTLIIGIGNMYRSDDAVGILIARKLAELAIPDTRILEEAEPDLGLIDTMEGAGAVILIDAASSGSPPGTIHRFDAALEPLPVEFFSYSTHSMSVAEVIELGRAFRRLPPRLTVYGIEGAVFSPGTELSGRVRRSIGPAAQKILREITSTV